MSAGLGATAAIDLIRISSLQEWRENPLSDTSTIIGFYQTDLGTATTSFDNLRLAFMVVPEPSRALLILGGIASSLIVPN